MKVRLTMKNGVPYSYQTDIEKHKYWKMECKTDAH